MINTLCLVAIFAVLIGFLFSRKIPRQLVIGVVFVSAWIYALCFFVGLHVFDRLAPNLIGGLVPYFPPVIPVCIFVAWSLVRARKTQR
jgi:hypothetical protein